MASPEDAGSSCRVGTPGTGPGARRGSGIRGREHGGARGTDGGEFGGETLWFWEIWGCKIPSTALLEVQEPSQEGFGGSGPHEKHFWGCRTPSQGGAGGSEPQEQDLGCRVLSTALSGPFPGQLCEFSAPFPCTFEVLPPFLPPFLSC